MTNGRQIATAVIFIGLGALSGCAGVKDLKAPCRDRGETAGAVSAYQASPSTPSSAFAAFDACGELKPIN
jgi:hypothetical protein